jgi:UDPglucose 6-dehydrogenase
MGRHSVAIIGANGWVGRAMTSVFPDAYLFDVDKGTMEEVNKRDVAFVCVPTPNLPDGSLDTSIVEKVVRECESKLIIIRSTVNPGTCDRLELESEYQKDICMQPEYLGETVSHPLFEEGKRTFLILGGRPCVRRRVIELYQTIYNANITIRQVTNYEAEVIKLSENRAIAYKVAQCQELYDACQKNGVDYNLIREAVYGDDPRQNLWFTFVYPDKRGFKSKCIPKDVYAWSAWAGKPELTEALLKYNAKLIDSNPQT